jgi:hypothetical protein
MSSELSEARDWGSDLLEEAIIAHFGNRCSKHADGCPTCEAWRQLDSLLARSACDGDGERDAARYRYVRETCYITFGGYGVKGDALDEAVDAAIAAKGAGE